MMFLFHCVCHHLQKILVTAEVELVKIETSWYMSRCGLYFH